MEFDATKLWANSIHNAVIVQYVSGCSAIGVCGSVRIVRLQCGSEPSVFALCVCSGAVRT